MFKKKYFLIVIFMLTVMLFLNGCGNSSKPETSTNKPEEIVDNVTEEKEITLTLSYPQPENSFYGDTYGYFAKRIEEESGGSIKVRIFPAASLVGDTEILDAVSRGNVDIGHIFGSYASPVIKDLIPYEIPGAYIGDQYEKLNDATFDISNKIFKEYGVNFIALSYPDTIGLLSNVNLVKSPEDMKGQVFRAQGKWVGEAFKIWGAAPATIPIGDLSTAIERGTVDGSYTSWMMTQSYKLFESGKYFTFTKLQNNYYGLIMNSDKWESLTANQQAAIEVAAADFRAYSQEVYNKQRATFEKELEEAGVEYYELTDEENADFINSASILFDEIKNEIGPNGLELIDVLNAID